MNLVLLRYPNWYRGLLEGQVGDMPVRVQVSLGGLKFVLARRTPSIKSIMSRWTWDDGGRDPLLGVRLKRRYLKSLPNTSSLLWALGEDSEFRTALNPLFL